MPAFSTPAAISRTNRILRGSVISPLIIAGLLTSFTVAAQRESPPLTLPPFLGQQETGTLEPPGAASLGLSMEIRQALASGKVGAAREMTERLIREQPGNFEGPYWRGLIEIDAGNQLDAIRYLRRAESIQANGLVLKALGIAYYLARQYRLFQQKMTQASEKDPRDFAPLFFLGRYQDEHSQFHKSQELFSKALELNPEHYPSHYYLGYAYEAQHETTLAERHHSAALDGAKRAGKSFHLPYLGLARLRAAANEHAVALPYAQQAVAIKPNDAEAHKILASVLVALDRTAEAIPEWEAATKLDRSDGQIQYQLSQAYRKLGDEKKADEALAQFKRIMSAYGN